MALPAEPYAALAYAQGVTQPLRITEGIVRGDLARTLSAAAAEAESLMVFNLKKGNFSGKVTAAQMKAATNGLGSISASIWGKVGADTRSGIYAAAELAVDQGIDNDFLVGMPFKAITMYQEQMYFDAFAGAEAIIARRNAGFRLADRIYRNGSLTVAQVGKIVEKGLALQLSARDIAKKVRGHFDPNVKGGTSYAAMRLARTEINNAHHEITLHQQKKRPWIHYSKWHLSSSHPRPDPCDELANDDHVGLGSGVMTKGNVPPKPHPQCLCYVTAIQPPRDQFINNLASGDYDDWLDSHGVYCG